ncbi:hypothetical protein ACFFQW_28945 [Umezawaea endophytica]|uniref:Uncharacterized protein n=1 Tax=Umezawaea endophytica TaxID=1654476 RepID=A0A9X3ALA8_9PSEU|nr:hypothetical protein [Umezawaea endophytica]MCS7484140.1 hypothetical protein [Umezawaea endophytica]
MERSDIQGSIVTVIPQHTILWAVDALVQNLSADEITSLRVRSGEHLAAIITTAFMFSTPTEIDSSGGADLVFDVAAASDSSTAKMLTAGAKLAAFEAKSITGDFRRFDAQLDQMRQRGEDTSNTWHEVTVKSANTILNEARPQILRARDQLLKKVAPTDSRNVFLLVHPLDQLAIECVDDNPVIGHLLDPIDYLDDVDTLWVLWVPDHLTVWSTKRQAWINLIFAGTLENERPIETGVFSLLQTAESEFLTKTGNVNGSPYMFAFSSGEDGEYDA